MDLQVELERTERRPVTVQEWAVAAGHPSSHQLMEALQEGRKAERTMVLCHQELVRSVSYRWVNVPTEPSGAKWYQVGLHLMCSYGLLHTLGCSEGLGVF